MARLRKAVEKPCKDSRFPGRQWEMRLRERSRCAVRSITTLCASCFSLYTFHEVLYE